VPRAVLIGLAAGLAAALSACAVLAPVPETLTEPRSPVVSPAEGVRIGVVAATLDGRVVRAERAGERFIPASNTKIFTAAAAFLYLPGLGSADPETATSLVRLPAEAGAAPSLVIVGRGDATLRDGAGCIDNCLHQLADAVAARGITRVGDVIGDATHFPHEPFGLGWSWNNLPFYFGAPVSALTVNGNAATLRVAPDTAEGAPIIASWAEGDGLLRLRNDAVTGPPGSENLLSVLRLPGSEEVVLTGTLPADAQPRDYLLSVPEASIAAARRLIRLLQARGIVVEGAAKARTRGDGPLVGEELARLAAPPLLTALVNVLKDSDNLSAELLLQHIARARGGEGSETGLGAVHAMLEQAGIRRSEIELFDGSGLSPYNRISPDAAVRFLAWTARQPWGEAFLATLPVGGESGSLSRRFRGTPLEGRIFAKTGTVQGVNALSGFLVGASGERLVFSVIANDRPADAGSVLPLIDALLLDIAAAN
jgi:D-alanyl-D-alanine carboxypeptidase/D-alanyl-D-alanine-endopeptidase (penicillin-binding protein 4)